VLVTGSAKTYQPKLDAEVYASLLDMARTTKMEIGQLEPIDNIDIQSFIWVVGEYGAAEEAKVST
jgi:hypothetical protein